MPSNLLTTDCDPMGTAIAEYYRTGRAARLRVFSTMFDEDELPVSVLFRTEGQMSALERCALAGARGRVLDVGAGSGCHTLALQQRGLEVDAIDVSPLSVGVMQARGVRSARHADFFDEGWRGTYDTILMLMNGSGIVGKVEFLPRFFERADRLLAPGGAVWMDSSDLRYIYEDEDGNMPPEVLDGYYGEVDYRMCYRGVEGKPFDWLYVDFDTLAAQAAACGFVAEKMADGEHYDYLARLSRSAERK